MKNILKLLLVTALTAALLLSVGCSLLSEQPKTFTQEKFSITLTNRYQEMDQEGFTAAFASNKVAVLFLEESFQALEGSGITADSTLPEYAETVIEVQNLTDSTPKTEDGVTYFTYESTVDGTKYCYLASVHKSEDAFWLVQYGCKADQFEDLKDDFLTYAKSISFS